MSRIALVLWMALVMSVATGCGQEFGDAIASEPEAAVQAQPETLTQEQTAAIAQAEQAGVEIGKQFEFSLQKDAAMQQLFAADAAEQGCRAKCSNNREGAIVCPVGKMCQCGCPGGYPDCSCR